MATVAIMKKKNGLASASSGGVDQCVIKVRLFILVDTVEEHNDL